MNNHGSIQTELESNQVQQGVDSKELKLQINEMYSDVALNPNGDFHFKMGKNLTEILGYPQSIMKDIPDKSIESFAGVGYFFDLVNLSKGETILDLGSGSGMDTFYAALSVGTTGIVKGVDMNQDQLDKAEMMRNKYNFDNVEFINADIEQFPFEDNKFDVVMSNGVFNLIPNKKDLFVEIYRILKQGGRLVFSDIITERSLPETVKCNSNLWASCIGGAEQKDLYIEMIENAGFTVVETKYNKEYTFISEQASNASEKWGVKSYSFLGVKR